MKITALTKFVSPETTKVVSVWADYEVALAPRMVGQDEDGNGGWQQGWKIVDQRDDALLGWAIHDEKEGYWKPYVAASAYDLVGEDLSARYERTGSYGADPRHKAANAAQGEPVAWETTRTRAFEEILFVLSRRGTERLTTLARIHMDDLLKELTPTD